MPSPAPSYRITLNGGVDIAPRLRPWLITLRLTDCSGVEADQLDIELDDTQGQLALPERGAVLSVAIGWDGEPLADKGTFKIDEIEHDGPPDRLIIRARSADFGLNFRTRIEQSWHELTLGTILLTIAKRNELEPRVDATLHALLVDHLDQQESDAEFITRLAKQYDAVATVKRGKLIFVPFNHTRSASKTRSSNQDYTGVRAYWVKAGRKTLHRVLAGTTGHVYRLEQPRHTSKAAAERAAGAMWAQLQASQRHRFAMSELGLAVAKMQVAAQAETDLPTIRIDRSESERHNFRSSERDAYSGVRGYYHDPNRAARRSVLVGLAGNVKNLRETFVDEADARQAAQAEWQRIERGAAEFDCTLARGRADLAAVCPVALTGWRQEITRVEWQARRVTHTITGSGGFTTNVECEVQGARSAADGEAQEAKDAEDAALDDEAGG